MKEPTLKITQRNLPHWELDGSVYFITFNTWEKLELTPEARQVVLSVCKFFNNQRYQIFALVVMPDHVHMLIQPLLKSENEFWSLSSIMHSIKSYSAKQVPKVMKHIGTVWQSERYDRINRNEREFQATWEYIRQNLARPLLVLLLQNFNQVLNHHIERASQLVNGRIVNHCHSRRAGIMSYGTVNKPRAVRNLLESPSLLICKFPNSQLH
jgi:putative transposase